MHIKVLLMLSFSGLCQKSRRRRYKVRGDMVDLIGFEPTTPHNANVVRSQLRYKREKSILFHCPLDGKQFSICVDTLCYMWYLS